MSEMRVPKRQVPAELILPGGRSFPVMLFLAEYVLGRDGGERPSDLLLSEETFLPALTQEGGNVAAETTFFHRKGILALRVPAEAEPVQGDGPLESRHGVALAMDDGTTLKGELRYVLPIEHSRLYDALNQPEPLLRLYQGDSVLLVNKKHISRVSPSEA